MVEVTQAPDAARIVVAPHCSLSVRGAWAFFGGLCAVSFAIALFFAFHGFWPVLPFAGLEMALVGWALKSSMDRRHHRQTITITEREVQVDDSTPPQPSRTVFQRHWARVRMLRAQSPLHPSRLLIESHGRRCEIGSFLNEQERLSLAQRLKRLVGSVSQSPPLHWEAQR